MLERVWRKGNPLTLLVGMQTSTATMENSVEIPYIFFYRSNTHIQRASLVAQMVKSPSAMQETWVQSPGGEDPLEKGMAAHLSFLAWRIP